MKKGITIIFLLLFVVFSLGLSQAVFAVDPPVYSDIDESHPYYDAVMALTDAEVLVGYGDGTFRPDQPVTRVEFLKMGMMYLGEYGVRMEKFADCFDDTIGHWGENIICEAQSDEIVHGDSTDGLFHPDRNVNFVEAAKIVDQIENGPLLVDSDPWYLFYVQHLEIMRAVPPSVLTLDHFLTRAEVAEIMFRAVDGIAINAEFNTGLYTDSPFEFLSRDHEVVFTSDGNPITWTYLGGEYSLMGDFIYYSSRAITDDVENFRQIDDPDCGNLCPWMDSENIYYGLFTSPNLADGVMDFLSEDIAVTQTDVYYRGFLHIEGLDASSFELIHDYFVKDTNNVYYFGPDLISQKLGLKVFEKADVETFQAVEPLNIYEDLLLSVDHLSDKNNSYLILQGDFFDGKGNLWHQFFEAENPDLVTERLSEKVATLTIPNPDNELIEFIGKHHFRVGDRFYYMNNQIEGADPASFEVFMGEDFEQQQIFSRDASHVYVRGEMIEGADPDTFVRYPDSFWYYLDKNYLYNYDGMRLEGADLDTFEIVGGGSVYAVDANQVYVYGLIVPNADPDTFVYDYGCSYDADSYFLRDADDYYQFVEVTEKEWLAVCAPV